MHRLSACTGVSVDKVLRIAVADVEKKARLVQVHELRVVIHAVQNLRIHRLCDRCVKVCSTVTIWVVKLHVHVVVRILVQHLTEHVPLGLVRVPELR